MNTISEDRITLFRAAVCNMQSDLLGGDIAALEMLRDCTGNVKLDIRSAMALLVECNPHTQDQCEDGTCEDHLTTIHYRHEHPDASTAVFKDVSHWTDTWNCAVNGECPDCGAKDIEPQTYHDSDNDSDCVDCE